jgi:hypothetical protein
LPKLQIEASGGVTLLNERVVAQGGFLRSTWRDIQPTFSVYGRAVARPLSFVRFFGELEQGTRGLPIFPNPRPIPPAEGEEGEGQLELTPTVRSDLSSIRVGAEIHWPRLRAGGALIDMSVDSIAAFGLPFDSAFRAFPGNTGRSRAWEAWGRVDLARFWGGSLYAEGGWTTWFSGLSWAYRPADRGTVGAGLHIVPLQSNNLEVRGRIWLDRRGVTLEPRLDEGGAPFLQDLGIRSVVHADLMIRIIDVRIFARYEDWGGVGINDLFGRTIRGPRIFYGVKWHFFN